MRAEEWVCDRCGTGGHGRSPLEISFGIDGERHDRDLCSECVRDLLFWIDRSRA
jgi:hypothetical protein